MIARVTAGGQPDVEPALAQRATGAEEFAPRPAKQPVFSGEGGPGCGQRHQLDRGREAREQWGRVRLGDESHANLRCRSPEKRKGECEIAKAPELDREQARKIGGVCRRFGQVGVAKV